MHQYHRTLAFAVLASALSSCGGGSQPVPQSGRALQEGGSAGLRADRESRDFGDLGHGEMVITTFCLTNESAESIRIASIKTDCPCTTATVGEEAVAPGETMPVEVVLDSHGLVGREVHSVVVLTDKGQEISLRVGATIVEE